MTRQENIEKIRKPVLVAELPIEGNEFGTVIVLNKKADWQYLISTMKENMDYFPKGFQVKISYRSQRWLDKLVEY